MGPPCRPSALEREKRITGLSRDSATRRDDCALTAAACPTSPTRPRSSRMRRHVSVRAHAGEVATPHLDGEVQGVASSFEELEGIWRCQDRGVAGAAVLLPLVRGEHEGSSGGGDRGHVPTSEQPSRNRASSEADSGSAWASFFMGLPPWVGPTPSGFARPYTTGGGEVIPWNVLGSRQRVP